jgi:hypothetical protein
MAAAVSAPLTARAIGRASVDSRAMLSGLVVADAYVSMLQMGTCEPRGLSGRTMSQPFASARVTMYDRGLRVTLQRVLLLVAAPLVLGALVYVAWRPTDVVLVGWLPAVIVHALRTTLGSWHLPRVIVESAPDLAWAWAFGAALALVWRARPWRAKAPWVAVGLIVAASAEIGQLWGVPPGTFDVMDLAAIVVGYALGATAASCARSSAALR